jgi:hypothetical protein
MNRKNILQNDQIPDIFKDSGIVIKDNAIVFPESPDAIQAFNKNLAETINQQPQILNCSIIDISRLERFDEGDNMDVMYFILELSRIIENRRKNDVTDVLILKLKKGSAAANQLGTRITNYISNTKYRLEYS